MNGRHSTVCRYKSRNGRDIQRVSYYARDSHNPSRLFSQSLLIAGGFSRQSGGVNGVFTSSTLIAPNFHKIPHPQSHFFFFFFFPKRLSDVAMEESDLVPEGG